MTKQLCEEEEPNKEKGIRSSKNGGEEGQEGRWDWAGVSEAVELRRRRRGDGAQCDSIKPLPEGNLLLLCPRTVPELRWGAEGEQTAGGTGQPALPLYQRAQELLLPPYCTCTWQPHQVRAITCEETFSELMCLPSEAFRSSSGRNLWDLWWRHVNQAYSEVQKSSSSIYKSHTFSVHDPTLGGFSVFKGKMQPWGTPALLDSLKLRFEWSRFLIIILQCLDNLKKKTCVAF